MNSRSSITMRRIGEAFDACVIHSLLTGVWADGRTPPRWLFPALVAAFGSMYGAVMGSWSGAEGDRWLMIPYAAIKVPLLFLATTAICLPGYFVLCTVAGLRSDFSASLSSIVGGQAATAMALGSLAPVTGFAYLSGVSHTQALTLSAAIFGVSTMSGYVVMLRRFRALIARRPRHRATLIAWVMMYAFVGTQLGWMLRPFVGSPELEVGFLRPEPFSNAYEAVGKIVWAAIRGEER